MNEKTTLTIINIVLGLCVITASLSLHSPALAQSQNDIVIPFSEVGIDDIVLRGPYDSQSVFFSLPDNWQLLDGTAIELYVEIFIASEQRISTQFDEYAGAILNVYFNQRLQQSITLVTGDEKVYRIPIRVQDLDTETSDGRVQISFFLDAGIDCDYGFHKTTVKIAPESVININYSEETSNLDLRNLPRPIYKRDSYFPELAKVVISEKATADELRAAYLVMTAFGRMTNRRLDLELITSEQITQSVQEEAHLIFVGKATSFPILFPLQMPVPITDNKYTSPMLQTGDGLVQMMPSPWNPLKVAFIVGGNTDSGVVKASQALTTGNIQTGFSPAVSFIAEVSPIQKQVIQDNSLELNSILDYTLADLGYPIQQTSVFGTQIGFGTQWFSYEIDIPVGQYAEEQSYFDLVFSRSSLVDSDRSEINMFVNGTLAGSAAFTEEETSFIKKRIDIPPTLFQPGRNQIDLAVDLFPYDSCTTLNLNGLWMSIYPESSIHIALTSDVSKRSQVLELRNYPHPFLVTTTLSDLTVVLPKADPTSWISFGELIYDLGGQATGEVISFNVSFSGMLSDNDRRNNLIFFGVPTDLLLDDELNAAMPAPFEQNSNIAVLDDQTVIYRIGQDKSLGYLELLSSPWNEEKTILAVLGTNAEGLLFSKQALIASNIRGNLNGNFATIDGEQFAIVDTRSGLGLGSFPVAIGSEAVEESFSTPELEFETVESPNYNLTRQNILFLLTMVAGAILLVIILAFVFRKRNLPKN